MSPVLVTGGAGFIGSYVVDHLLAEGEVVTVLDNFTTGHEENLRHHAGDHRLRVVRGSVLDVDLVEQLTRDHELVLHLAAAVGVRYILQDPLQSLLTNVRGTEIILAAAQRYGRRVLLASTSEIYGKSERVPFREDSERLLGPTWVHRWSYSTAKAIDEHLAFAYVDHGVRVSIVRYFNSYGPRLAEDGYGSVIARFAAQALRGEPLTVHGDGRQTRCFTFVYDTVRGTLLAARRDEAVGHVFNIGSTEEVSILDLAQRVVRILGSASPIRFVPYESHYPSGFEDTRRRVPDVTRARAVLGFEATVPLEKGLARTLAWCREHYRAEQRR